jgi:hypothetical protein
MTSPIVTEIRRNGNPVGERVELGRYTIRDEERVLYGQRVHGVVRVTDVPACGRGRAYLVERELELGTGGEMRFSPFEAMSQRQDTQITWGHILTASVQRLAFWRR